MPLWKAFDEVELLKLKVLSGIYAVYFIYGKGIKQGAVLDHYLFSVYYGPLF